MEIYPPPPISFIIYRINPAQKIFFFFMDIQTIGVFRFAVEDAINMLARLGGKSYDLPAIEEVEALITRLERISPFEVVASILADNYYKSHRQHYLAAFGGVLNCEAFIGSVKADGKIIDYWGGLADKLKAAHPEIDKNKYLSLVERLSNLVQENITGMKKDLDGIFSDEETAPEPQRWENLLPDGLRTDEAVSAFSKAIESDLIEICGDRLKWKKSKALLAYFLGNFLKQDGTFPDKHYCLMFGESRLGKALSQLADNKNGNGKPRGYEEIDNLLASNS